MRFTKLDPEVVELLRCANCKGQLRMGTGNARCVDCGTGFGKVPVNVGTHVEEVFDFRVHRPSWCSPAASREWEAAQQDFEAYVEAEKNVDNLQAYIDEIEGVREVYTNEFEIAGSVLDVGGHQGRLRHFLRPSPSLYVSVDPSISAFETIALQRNLLRAYPSLTEPCNFVASRAEELPFASKSFAWVHMRSVVDHFEDPFKAFKEAYRVLRPGGSVLVGLAIMERKKDNLPVPLRPLAALRRKGFWGLFRGLLRKAAARARIPIKSGDHHIFHFTEGQLRSLMLMAGFQPGKTHWQKAPFSYCIYAAGTVPEERTRHA